MLRPLAAIRAAGLLLALLPLGCSGDIEDAGLRAEPGAANSPANAMAGAANVAPTTSAGTSTTPAGTGPTEPIAMEPMAGAGVAASGAAGAGTAGGADNSGGGGAAQTPAGGAAVAGTTAGGMGAMGGMQDPTEPDPMDPAEPDPMDPAEPDPMDPAEPDPTQPVECTNEPPPAPPAEFQSTIDITWTEMTGGYQGTQGARSANANVANRTTMILDKVMDNGGTLSYCVRYQSDVTVTAEQRDAVQPALERGVNAWFENLVGYDCFPYATIAVSVTGWAAESRTTFDWDDGVVPLYIGMPGGSDGFPPCDNACSWGQGRQPDYPNCEGGYENHYDLELRLEEGLGNTGYGEDFGEWLDRAGFMNSLDGTYHIYLHEFGHGFGFPDYYDWDSWGQGEDSPNSVMVAGRAIVVTEWDGWMLRRLFSEVKDRWY